MRLPDIVRALYSSARTGWMLRGIPSCLAENIAQHSFAAALIAAEVAPRLGADPYKSALLALVHDLTEAKIGDIAKVAGVGHAKAEAEARAVKELELSDYIKSAIVEFNQGLSREALVAKASDLAATVLVSQFYKQVGFDVSEIEQGSAEELRRLATALPGLLEALREIGVQV